MSAYYVNPNPRRAEAADELLALLLADHLVDGGEICDDEFCTLGPHRPHIHSIRGPDYFPGDPFYDAFVEWKS